MMQILIADDSPTNSAVSGVYFSIPFRKSLLPVR